MASIIYQKNPKNGSVYVYRAEAYRDPETRKPKVHRTYLGRLDPLTHEIIEKAENGKRNRSGISQKQVDNLQKETRDVLESLRKRISDLEQEIAIMKEHEGKDRELFEQIADSIAKHLAAAAQ